MLKSKWIFVRVKNEKKTSCAIGIVPSIWLSSPRMLINPGTHTLICVCARASSDRSYFRFESWWSSEDTRKSVSNRSYRGFELSSRCKSIVSGKLSRNFPPCLVHLLFSAILENWMILRRRRNSRLIKMTLREIFIFQNILYSVVLFANSSVNIILEL